MHVSLYGAGTVPVGSPMEDVVARIIGALRSYGGPPHVLQFCGPLLARRISLSCASAQVLTGGTLGGSDPMVIPTGGLTSDLNATRRVKFVTRDAGWHAGVLGRLSYMLQFANAALMIDGGGVSEDRPDIPLEMSIALTALLRHAVEPHTRVRIVILTERPDVIEQCITGFSSLVHGDRPQLGLGAQVQIAQPDQLPEGSGLVNMLAEFLAGATR